MSFKSVATIKPKPEEEPLEDQIRRRAQQLYESRNPSDGSAVDDWLQAEKEIRGQRQKKAATAST